MPGFVVLVRERGDGDPTPRIGITVSKKVDTRAVVRNRMKRRYRELARLMLAEHGIAGADHILIGRGSGIERDWGQLQADFAKALAKVRRPSSPPWKGGAGGGSATGDMLGETPTHPQPLPDREGGKQ